MKFLKNIKKINNKKILIEFLRIRSFVIKYETLIEMTAYSGTVSDMLNGIESLSKMLKFFSKNIDGSNIQNKKAKTI